MARVLGNSWWTTVARAVSPQRGAVDNARRAVARDRRAAADRAEAAAALDPGRHAAAAWQPPAAYDRRVTGAR
jgi:hypothetical protein